MPFTTPDKIKPSDRLIASIWGDPKTGKTQFALTFPRPLFIFDWDHGLEHHMAKLVGEEVYVASYTYGNSLQPDSGDYIRLQSEFDADFRGALAAIKKTGSGSVVLDSGTAFWDMVQNAFMAENERAKKSRFDYGPPNAYVAQVFNLIKELPECNACIIHRAKEKYTSNGQAMGVYIQHGNKSVEYQVQVQLNMKFTGGRHYAILESSWDAPFLAGTEIDDPTYESVKATLLPFRQASGSPS